MMNKIVLVLLLSILLISLPQCGKKVEKNTMEPQNQSIQKTQTPSNVKEINVFCKAAADGDLEKVKVLLQHTPSLINELDYDGNTALMCASIKGNKTVVEFLLSQGAEVNEAGANKWTALMYAAWQGHNDVVEFLISKGAKVNVKNVEGNTSLMYAAIYGHTSVVQLLISKGADVNSKNTAGQTILKRTGNKEIIAILKEHGAK